MRDVHDACREWLDEPGEFDDDRLEELVVFVRAQRIDAARDALGYVAQILCRDSSKGWKVVEIEEVLRTMRDSIEREATS